MATPDSPAIPDPPRPSGNPREAILIGLGFLALVALGAWWALSPVPVVDHRTASSGEATVPVYADYVGDAACSRCHPGEAASHSRSGHARTLLPASRTAIARGLAGTKVEDPEVAGVTWQFALEGGKLTLGRSDGGRGDRSPVEYAFGSGHHAMTFVSLIDRDPAHPVALEHRLTYFAHAKAAGLTPGHSLSGSATGNSPAGRVHTSSDTLKCFACHATTTSSRGLDELDERSMIPNVSCERCHGPGRSHVEAARRGGGIEALKMPQGVGSWTAAEQLEQCGQCHRTPAMVRPGSIRVDNPALVRHQPVGLAESACYRKSGGALSCVTCHDPHARASTDRPSYEASCLSCHQGPSRKACPVSPASGCIDCHMPRRDVARGMMMTDHWIRRTP